MTEQPENRPEDANPDAEATSASWVPADPGQAEATEPTVVGPPADPNVSAGSDEGEASTAADEPAAAAAEPAAAEPAEAEAARSLRPLRSAEAAAAEPAEPAAAAPAPAEPPPAVAAAEPAPPVVPPPPLADAAANDGSTLAAGPREDRPEVAVGAAFVGGFALAMILRRLAR